MGKADQAQLREQRLAAKLRENLKRRKEQARARIQDADSGQDRASPAAETDTDNKP